MSKIIKFAGVVFLQLVGTQVVTFIASFPTHEYSGTIQFMDVSPVIDHHFYPGCVPGGLAGFPAWLAEPANSPPDEVGMHTDRCLFADGHRDPVL